MACVIQPCLGKAEPAQCLWREACRELDPGRLHALLAVIPTFSSRCLGC